MRCEVFDLCKLFCLSLPCMEACKLVPNFLSNSITIWFMVKYDPIALVVGHHSMISIKIPAACVSAGVTDKDVVPYQAYLTVYHTVYNNTM